ncbi:hypothetical protein B0H11DRAFT_1164068 [Mycena galericulata]|nr:hypothetical protein B0H11DRAFT_1164068 [Mycena galericulata]
MGRSIIRRRRAREQAGVETGGENSGTRLESARFLLRNLPTLPLHAPPPSLRLRCRSVRAQRKCRAGVACGGRFPPFECKCRGGAGAGAGGARQGGVSSVACRVGQCRAQRAPGTCVWDPRPYSRSCPLSVPCLDDDYTSGPSRVSIVVSRIPKRGAEELSFLSSTAVSTRPLLESRIRMDADVTRWERREEGRNARPRVRADRAGIRGEWDPGRIQAPEKEEERIRLRGGFESHWEMGIRIDELGLSSPSPARVSSFSRSGFPCSADWSCSSWASHTRTRA